MKILQTALIIATVALFACNTEPKTTETVAKDSTTTASTPSPTTDIKLPGYKCYINQAAGDSFWLQLNIFENNVTGNLKYIFKEKDSNRGELEGAMKGDTLIADYTFRSEGQKSVRQVAFLLKDSTATEGYGDMEEKDGKLMFKNPGKLTFSQGIVMKLTSCAQ